MDDPSIVIDFTCPTCGCTKSESEQPKENEDYTDDWPFTCAYCGRTSPRKERIEANSESIDAAVDNMKDEIVEASRKKSLRRRLRGGKLNEY